MSLQSFKEALKPCRNSSSLTIPSTQSQSSISQPVEEPTIPRRPPKSSPSQQLLRLQDPLSLPPIQTKQIQDQNGSEDEVDEEEDDPEPVACGSPKVGFFEFDHTGPYEPLVLSCEGEFPVVQVPASINCRLLEHQREGVKFLYTLYKNNHGGILGDDMGLGKTIQTIAFLAAVFGKDGYCIDSTVLKKYKTAERASVLIVCPTSVIHNWENEFSKWSNFSVAVYHGANGDLIYNKLGSHEVEILITSFDTYRICGSQLSEVNWEIVIVDEAHQLKNEKSKLYIACLEFKTLKRIGLTGTIMQNKIMELFNLFDGLRLDPWEHVNIFGSFMMNRSSMAKGQLPLKDLFVLLISENNT